MIVYQLFSGTAFKDFKDLENKSRYIKYLGCDTVWLTPILESNSYHRYDATNFYKIDKSLGSIEDFEHCTDLLHSNGIKVMKDFVVTHTSNKHEWFLKAEKGEYPFVNYYVWSDTKHNTSQDSNCHDQSSDNQWHYNNVRNKYYLGAFGSDMPNLNLDNQDVKNELVKVLKYWYGLGVDYLRLDSVKHIYSSNNLEFWRWFRKECKKIGINHLVGECWSDVNLVNAYSNAIGSCFDFPSKYIIQDKIKYNCMRDIPYELNVLNHKYNNLMSMFLDNHDMDRIASELNDIDKLKYAGAILLTSKGIPYIYYGTEIGKQGVKWNGDEYVRTSIDLDDTNLDLFTIYKKLINIRKESDVLKYGDMIPLETDKRNSLCFERRFYGQSIFIAIVGENDTHVQIPWASYKALMTNSDYTGEFEFYGQSLDKGIYIFETL